MKNFLLITIANQATDADYKAFQSGLLGPNYNIEHNLFLARGHLTPAGDFGDINKEKSFTYVLTNIAPQWQPFNMGNWVAVEKAITTYAKSTGKTLYIVTGTGKFIIFSYFVFKNIDSSAI